MFLNKPSAPQRADWSGRLASLLARAAVLVWKLTTAEARQTMHRYLAHLAVLTLALGALAMGGASRSDPQELADQAQDKPLLSYTMRALANAAPVTPESNPTAMPLAVGGALMPHLLRSADFEIVQRQAQPHTDVPHRLRLEIITYTVQAGDTVQGIAITYGLEDTTIMWCNPAIEDMPDFLRIDQEVVIPPIDGVCHTVNAGDTLDGIAGKYKVDAIAITGVSYNHLQVLGDGSPALEPGIRLIVAGGQKPYVPKIVTAYNGPVPEGARGTGLFQWPATGRITQSYWWGHRAIDIAAYSGAPIYAADGGFVSFAGWTDIGYGYLLIVDHANGYATYYAHCSGFYVTVGESVERGQLVAAMGSTGNSSGPHVHFEIRYDTTLLNPRGYLP